jgi:lipid II:glycine glycyltransferase (peptidoglycan interpeptide bridge formation enzyme)
MTTYLYPGRIFRKEWHWFERPVDTEADIINVFSYEDIDAIGFKKKSALTTIIDLKKSEDDLYSKFRRKFIREQIEKGTRNGIFVSVGIRWEELVPVYREFRQGKKISTDDPRVFRNCLIAGAYQNGKMIAGGAFIGNGTHLRALALASRRFHGDGKMREVVGQANRMLIWEVMRYAKNDGYAFIDLGGISPESPDPGERSLAEFKEAFGGERKLGYYYTKVNSPILKLWIKLRRFLRV